MCLSDFILIAKKIAVGLLVTAAPLVLLLGALRLTQAVLFR